MIQKRLSQQSGFTLIEMLIVVILLGILAMLIIPQISVSTDDARLNTLETNLGAVRSSVELYYFQHNDTYPGENKTDGTAAATPAEAEAGFLQQLTQYTDLNGDCSVSRDATHIYGPYLKSLTMPTNPYNNLNTTLCDIATTDITDRTSDNSTGWKFYTQTGVLMANDGGHDNL
jgi:prepilin-type N-terminal cleavage/methylation domain-containing protein